MARKPDTPCSSCGRLLFRGGNSLPNPTCQPCRRARWPVSFTCVACGGVFERLRPKSRPKVCSRVCALALARPGTPGTSRRDRQCEVCGKSYRATYSKQRTCGRICGAVINARHRREREKPREKPKPREKRAPVTSRVWFPDCRQCGRVFAARSGRTKLCSEDCRKAHKAAYERHYNQTVRPSGPRECGCGTPLTGRQMRCVACIALSRRQRKERNKRRRRALKMGAATEPYTLAEIAARDRNTCGLCRKRVAMTKAVPHLKAPTIDHIVPLSEGGDDTRANVQLAHFICNSRKSARGSQQLTLVG